MNISSFKSQLLAGGSRPNQFLVTLNWPAAVGSPGGDHNLLISSASLPASSVNPTIVQYRGREVKFAGERTFDPWTVSVLNDTDMTMRSYLEKWSNAMNDLENNGGLTAPSAYMVDLIVQQLDRNDDITRTYDLRGAFPINVSEVALSYSANDMVSEFSVTWAYQDFQVAMP
jgi:hypothetical protein